MSLLLLPVLVWHANNAKVGELLALLRGHGDGKGIFESYPVVASLDGMAFVGTISRKDLVGRFLHVLVLSQIWPMCTQTHGQ